MQGSRWEAGGSGGQQGPRSDRRRPRQEAAHGERAGPRTMTDHAATTWVVRLTTHCARGRGGCVPKRDRNDPIRYEQNALAFLFARSAGRSRSPINRIQICELVVFWNVIGSVWSGAVCFDSTALCVNSSDRSRPICAWRHARLTYRPGFQEHVHYSNNLLSLTRRIPERVLTSILLLLRSLLLQD